GLYGDHRWLMPELVGALHHFDLGKWNDHLAACREELLLTLHDTFLEVPREHEEIIGLHCPRLGFRHDGNVRARSERSELVRIDVGDGLDGIAPDTAELQHDVPLGRGAGAEDAL